MPGRPSYGRSLIVDPWGIVLAQAPDGEGVITAELDAARLEDVRARLPSLASRQPCRVPVAHAGVTLHAVVFDVDFTLVKPGPDLGPEGYRRLGERHGLELDPSRYDDGARGGDRLARAASGARPRRRDLGRVHRADRPRHGRRRRAGARECAVEMTRRLGAPRELRPLRGHAARCSTSCRGYRLKLGLVSNTGRDLDAFVRHHRLDVDAALGSRAHGRTKPHETIFRAMLDALAVEPADAVMVGRLARGRRRRRAGARDGRDPARPRAAGIRATRASGSQISTRCRRRSACRGRAESRTVQLVVLCGAQGAGKTSFYRYRFFETHVRVNLDMLRTRARERIARRGLHRRAPAVRRRQHESDRRGATPLRRAGDGGRSSRSSASAFPSTRREALGVNAQPAAPTSSCRRSPCSRRSNGSSRRRSRRGSTRSTRCGRTAAAASLSTSPMAIWQHSARRVTLRRTRQRTLAPDGERGGARPCGHVRRRRSGRRVVRRPSARGAAPSAFARWTST